VLGDYLEGEGGPGERPEAHVRKLAIFAYRYGEGLPGCGFGQCARSPSQQTKSLRRDQSPAEAAGKSAIVEHPHH